MVVVHPAPWRRKHKLKIVGYVDDNGDHNLASSLLATTPRSTTTPAMNTTTSTTTPAMNTTTSTTTSSSTTRRTTVSKPPNSTLGTSILHLMDGCVSYFDCIF